MVNTSKIFGLMAERGITKTEMADKLGITPNTFYRKMKRGKLDSDEMSQMIQILGIENPTSIFFAEFGTQRATNY